jgi:glycosyltransferase involved in cell wall biosynthesis
MISWEYPPIVEGGLARHVRKLSEALAALGEEVHVLTRGRAGDPARELLAGVHVHRVPEPPTPRDLDAFLAWVEALNWDMAPPPPGSAASTSSTATTGSSPAPPAGSRAAWAPRT